MVSGGAVDILDLVEYLACSRDPLSVSAIATGSGLAKSSCHRLLKILVAKGYAERDKDNRYRLIRAVGSGGLPSGHARLAEIARPFLHQAADQSGVSAFLAVLTQAGLLRYIVKILPANQEIFYDRDVSRDREPRLVASGLCLLAYRDESSDAQLEAVRRTGIAVNLEGVVEGAAGIAAPVFGERDQPVAAVNLAGPKHLFAGENQDRIAGLAKEAARSIGESLRQDAKGRLS